MGEALKNGRSCEPPLPMLFRHPKSVALQVAPKLFWMCEAETMLWLWLIPLGELKDHERLREVKDWVLLVPAL